MVDEDWDEPVMLVHPDDDRRVAVFEMRIDEARQELAQVCAGRFVTHVSLAMAAIQSAVDHPDAVLTPLACEELSLGLATAHALARIEGVDIELDVLKRGIEAVTGQLRFLSQAMEARRSWPGEILLRLGAEARVLRDLFHNLSLLSEARETEEEFAAGECGEADLSRALRRMHGRIAANRCNIAVLERDLARMPPRTRPPLRLVS